MPSADPGRRDFDAAAPSWDEDPSRVRMAHDVADAVARAVPLRPDMKILDYGCGTGNVGLRLRAKVGALTGADGSEGMLRALEEKVRRTGLQGVRTLKLDLEKDPPPAERFDLIVSSMTLHHVRDTGALLRRLRELLLPGGVLCLADLEAEDGSFHADPSGVHHHGFERGRLEAELRAAGFRETSWSRATTVVKTAGSFPVFLVRAS